MTDFPSGAPRRDFDLTIVPDDPTEGFLGPDIAGWADTLARYPSDDGGQTFAQPRSCRKCGCTDVDACIIPGGQVCSWLEPDLCSACAHWWQRLAARLERRYRRRR